MKVLVSVVKPLLIAIAHDPAVKNLVLDLLQRYVKSTDNSIDDVIYALVKDKMFTPQA